MIFDQAIQIYEKTKVSDGIGGYVLTKANERYLECKITIVSNEKVVDGNKIRYKDQLKLITSVPILKGTFVFYNDIEYKILNQKVIKDKYIHTCEEVVWCLNLMWN